MISWAEETEGSKADRCFLDSADQDLPRVLREGPELKASYLFTYSIKFQRTTDDSEL